VFGFGNDDSLLGWKHGMITFSCISPVLSLTCDFISVTCFEVVIVWAFCIYGRLMNFIRSSRSLSCRMIYSFTSLRCFSIIMPFFVAQVAVHHLHSFCLKWKAIYFLIYFMCIGMDLRLVSKDFDGSIITFSIKIYPIWY